MARGGKREGAGRPKGARNKPKAPLPIVTAGADAAIAEQVALLVGGGLDAEQISIALRIPPLELRARFGRELEHGATITKALLVSAMAAAALKGNVAGAKAVLRLSGETAPEEPSEATDPSIERALRLINGGRNA